MHLNNVGRSGLLTANQTVLYLSFSFNKILWWQWKWFKELFSSSLGSTISLELWCLLGQNKASVMWVVYNLWTTEEGHFTAQSTQQSSILIVPQSILLICSLTHLAELFAYQRLDWIGNGCNTPKNSERELNGVNKHLPHEDRVYDHKNVREIFNKWILFINVFTPLF